MIISDLSVKRPVFASVVSLLLIVFGLVSFNKIPLREYPDIDPPIVSISTDYRGASASVVERTITEIIEDRISGIEGIKSISSESRDGRSNITVEFNIDRDIEAATNDIRDRVSAIIDNLPDQADPPDVQKSNSDDDVILWLNVNGEGMSVMELTDYARRYLVDRFSSLDGVARVRIGGAKDKVMKIAIDQQKLAARELTVSDIETALRNHNLELPAGQIESLNQDFTVRMISSFTSEDDFKNLVLQKGDNGYLVRLQDVANVSIAPLEERGFFRGNGITMIGIGIIKQSTANTLEVAQLAQKKMLEVNETLPPNVKIESSYDTSVFIESSINEVYTTLFIAILLVVVVIYSFLGSVKAMIVPALTVPISLIATFIALYAFGYTINLLTLLALVLAIGLVVDDTIVVLENIYRRIELGEPRLVAAFRGARQVGFAVIATTLVLVAVFIPIAFLDGDVGRLFSEFAVAMAVGVMFSSFVALSLSVTLCSKMLDRKYEHNKFTKTIDKIFNKVQNYYKSSLEKVLQKKFIIIAVIVTSIVAAGYLFKKIPSEFVPKEDRGVIFLIVNGPEGSSYNYSAEYMNEIEKRLMPFVESNEFHRLLIRTPRGFGTSSNFNGGIGIIVLKDWALRKPVNYYINEIRKRTSDLAGVFVFPIVRQALGGGTNKPIQFVLGGPSYEDLSKWRDILMEEAKNNSQIIGLEYDYKETKPQIGLTVRANEAAKLGVNNREISEALETLFGTKTITTFMDNGEEYDVLLEIVKDQKNTADHIHDIYVRSDNGELVSLANLVKIEEFADSNSLNRYNKIRSITFSGNLADGYTLGEALAYLTQIVRDKLPANASIDYKGESLDYKDSGASIYFTFIMAMLIVFLVMSAQFESFVHPFVIIFSVPFAIVGALLGLYFFGQSLNIYSQIGLIMLIGLAVKNAILIVEFINQLRDEGAEYKDAIIEASTKRLRPIIMTSFTTMIGSVPLILSSGAGAETRYVIGIVILFGVLVSTLFTLYIVPIIYYHLAKNTSSPDKLKQKLEMQLQQYKDQR